MAWYLQQDGHDYAGGWDVAMDEGAIDEVGITYSVIVGVMRNRRINLRNRSLAMAKQRLARVTGG